MAGSLMAAPRERDDESVLRERFGKTGSRTIRATPAIGSFVSARGPSITVGMRRSLPLHHTMMRTQRRWALPLDNGPKSSRIVALDLVVSMRSTVVPAYGDTSDNARPMHCAHLPFMIGECRIRWQTWDSPQ